MLCYHAFLQFTLCVHIDFSVHNMEFVVFLLFVVTFVLQVVVLCYEGFIL